MNYKIKGVVVKPADYRELNGFKKFELLIETVGEQYPNQIPFAIWRKGADTSDVASLNPGDIVELDFYIKSRVWNGRYYTELTAVRIAVEKGDPVLQGNESVRLVGDSAQSFKEKMESLPF